MGGEPRIEWIEVTIDCGNVDLVAEFWRQLLGLVRLEDPLAGWRRAASTVPGGPALTFQPVPEPKTGKTVSISTFAPRICQPRSLGFALLAAITPVRSTSTTRTQSR
jgi:Glyoxalase-like domain